MGDADYIHAFQKVIMPIAMEFAPELVMSKFFVLHRGRDNEHSFHVQFQRALMLRTEMI
jgi:acetoin utilization deacetylase AcuC-like enzyme